MTGVKRETQKQDAEAVDLHRQKRSYELDMTHGKLIPKVAAFAVPLMFTSILQLLYNAADVIVVGRFTGAEALAAVGSTGSLINLILNLFLGLSIGTNVIAAKYYGANDYKGMQETVHTSVAVSLIGGVIAGAFGYIFSRTFLEWMGSPEDVLPLATQYIRIYFLGVPFNVLYNFGAAVLRAVGDTRRPLYFLSISGLVNVGLNLFFVIVCGMGVAGVAWATIISQMISAVLVTLCLIRSDGFVHLDLRKLRIHPDKLSGMLRVGLPAGFQGMCFSISNVLIQSTVNAYGAIVVAGNSASINLEGFIYAAMNSFYQAAITFISTNIGAGRYSRIRKSARACVTLVTLVGMALGAIGYLLMPQLFSIYSPDPQVIAAGMRRFTIYGTTYFLCGIMDTLCGALRGMGAAVLPMVVSLLGACAFRIMWIYLVLPLNNTLEMLYYSYPASWLLTGCTHLICYIVRLKRYPVNLEAERQLA